MKIIIGLGNPGDKYTGVRHNLGFSVVEGLARKVGDGHAWSQENKLKSEILKVGELLLVKPQTYMNNSGLAVSLLASFYKVSSKDIILVYDDLDLPLGKIKVRLGGAAAGHHGVESVIDSLGTDQFIRIRLGIGNLKTKSAEHKAQHINVEKFVLEPFMHSEKAKVKTMIKKAVTALQSLLKEGLEYVQNQYH